MCPIEAQVERVTIAVVLLCMASENCWCFCSQAKLVDLVKARSVVLIVTSNCGIGGGEVWEVNAMPGLNAEPDCLTPAETSTFFLWRR